MSAYLVEYTKGMGGVRAALISLNAAGRRRQIAEVAGNREAYSLAAELIDCDPAGRPARIDGWRGYTDLAEYKRPVTRPTALRLLRLARALRRLLPRAARMRPSEQEVELRAAMGEVQS